MEEKGGNPEGQEKKTRNPEVGSGGWNQGFQYSREGKRRYHT
jgi:hypothetical protein